MNHLTSLNEVEESCINSILDAGIDEIKTNQPSLLTSSQIMKKSQISFVFDSQEQSDNNNQQSLALKNIISSNNYISSSEEGFHQTINVEKENNQSSKTQKLEEMKNKLEFLQKQIALMDDKNKPEPSQTLFTSKNHRSLSFKSKGMNIKKKSNYFYKQFKSANNSFTKNEKINKKKMNSELYYKEQYLALKIEYDTSKSYLINQRKQLNNLNNKNNNNCKKALAYDELFENNIQILESNEKLLTKFEESETIRLEQAKLISSLQKEVERLRGEFSNDIYNLSGLNHKQKGKRKINKKIKILNFK